MQTQFQCARCGGINFSPGACGFCNYPITAQIATNFNPTLDFYMARLNHTNLAFMADLNAADMTVFNTMTAMDPCPL